ncbi:MAG: LuxR family transcriptional regulator [Psychroserpens sp.]|nr:LuxR family transcriptional regulator [Psychroserpens sp.]
MTSIGFKWLIAIVFIFGLQLNAQELPPVEVYTTKEYQGENQNWAVCQSSDRFIYVANNKGLLEFNGESWRLYNSPQETIMRSVHVIEDRVYTGSYMEFGYWKRDIYGSLNYTSLSEELNIPFVEDEEVWTILELDDWVLFQSLDRIIIYNPTDSTYKIVDSETKLTKAFKVNDTIYFQSLGIGLFKIEEGEALMFLDDPIVKQNTLVNLYDHQGKFLIQTQNDGFYIYENGIIPWDINSNELLGNVSVYSSIQLDNKGFALGTISNGLIYLKPNGDLDYQINQSTGLGNNTVLSLFEDIDNNIWLALDNGINCVNMNSPFSIYNDQKGTIGTVYTSIVYEGVLYLGTNQGLFYKELNSGNNFSFIRGTQGQVWSLDIINSQLFCAHNNGTFLVLGDRVQKITDSDGSWKVKTVYNRSDLLIEGTYNGLNILQKSNDQWKIRNKVEGFDISSRYFEFNKADEIFVSHEYKGVFKIKVDDDLRRVLEVQQETSVSKGLHSSLLKYNNDILYTYKDGIFRYDTDKFVRDSMYSVVFDKGTYTSGKLVHIEQTNKLWTFSSNGISYVASGKLSNEPKIENISLPNAIRNNMGGYENISYIDKQRYLFGSSSGYLIIDLDKLNHNSYAIAINSIKNTTENNDETLIELNSVGEFKNQDNDFQISYSVSEFDKYIEAEYQYQLEGIYDTWSNWSTTAQEQFKNLPHGDYNFKVRARIGDSISANIATYSFSIAKPWYITNVMLIIYALLIIAIILATHNIYKGYYRRQREEFLKTAQRELELKKLENEQQLMAFKNEKLQQDREGKNRELAISTMSLIKKNEFLNTIKNQLKEVLKTQDINAVIKVIDKDLNNTDDWRFFQEAFNNADKDFLKKVKAKHSELTPNDLKLCAYLRLNLTSKEIAPLLNISPRSVEVKRYRLRKKMNLPHESSLTNYILEI